MDQIKIGKFIADCRRAKKLTQAQLAEKLNITDRAVSKWETGKGMPDTAIMLELCDVLEISVNELLKGESVNMENYMKVAEENLLEMKKETEKQHITLLRLEVVLAVIGSVSLFVIILMSGLFVEEAALRAMFISIAFIIFLVAAVISLKIEQVAGFYECAECKHRYIPNYWPVFIAPHMGRTRYMKCPKCGQRSWNHKVLTK